MSKHQKALAALVTCVLFWGLSFISIKITVAVFPPMTLGALRFAMAVILLFFIKRKYAPEEKIQKGDIPLLGGAGITGVTLYFFFENNGVLLIPATEAAIIVGAVPVITLIADGLYEMIVSRRKAVSNTDAKADSPFARLSLLQKLIIPLIGALISLSGVALVAGVSFTLSGSALGYFYMAGACISWVCYCFLTRPLFSRRSRIFIVFWQSIIGFLGFLPFAFFENSSQMHTVLSWPSPLQMPGFAIWANVVFLGVFCSAMGYWLYSLAMRDLGVGTATLFINFIPVVSAIGAFFILGERLQPLQWLGAVLVLAGVYLAMMPSRKAP